MHLSENEGIEGKTFVVTGGLGYVGSALCLELLYRGASQVRSIDCRTHSPWSRLLSDRGVVCIHGDVTSKAADCVLVKHKALDAMVPMHLHAKPQKMNIYRQ